MPIFPGLASTLLRICTNASPVKVVPTLGFFKKATKPNQTHMHANPRLRGEQNTVV